MLQKSDIEVLETNENYVIFRTTCRCMSEHHTITVIADNWNKSDTPDLSLFFKVCYFPKGNWFERLWSKIKIAFKVLFCGFIDMEEEFLFRDKEHMIALTKALEEVILQSEKEKKDGKKENN